MAPKKETRILVQEKTGREYIYSDALAKRRDMRLKGAPKDSNAMSAEEQSLLLKLQAENADLVEKVSELEKRLAGYETVGSEADEDDEAAITVTAVAPGNEPQGAVAEPDFAGMKMDEVKQWCLDNLGEALTDKSKDGLIAKIKAHDNYKILYGVE